MNVVIRSGVFLHIWFDVGIVLLSFIKKMTKYPKETNKSQAVFVCLLLVLKTGFPKISFGHNLFILQPIVTKFSGGPGVRKISFKNLVAMENLLP